MAAIIRLKPNQYAHILDNNTQVTRVEVGPATITRQGHETLTFGPAEMVTVPPRSYCRIRNPVAKTADGVPVTHENGCVEIRYGLEEIRFECPPFPLYPGEELVVRPQPLKIVNPDKALRISALEDFDGHHAGDEWLFAGPQTYVPRVEERVVEEVDAVLVPINKAIVLEALSDFYDKANKVNRITGEKWLRSIPGAYLPDVHEKYCETIDGVVLSPVTAVLVKTTSDRKRFGKRRRAGESYLVTSEDTDVFIPDIGEEVVRMVDITVLKTKEFCVVLNPIDRGTGVQHFGERKLIKGECSFFLEPGEELESGIQDVYILSEEEALLLRAIAPVKEGDATHQPGERWLLKGPCEYTPRIEIEVLEKRSMIQLNEKEGIYVRNIDDGTVRAEIGRAYLLKENEELWEKMLSSEVEEIIARESKRPRDKTRVVAYHVPDKTAVQAFDYKTLTSRVVFGPDVVLLQPNETFTVLNLSSGFPKRQASNRIIGLKLGPDFIQDMTVVETSDHAALLVKMTYSWVFRVDRRDEESCKRMFFSTDFVGDVCRIIESRIRGAAAESTFDAFHKGFPEIIRKAVFGDEEEFVLENTNLTITSVDVQSVEPVNEVMRESLNNSVKQANKISLKTQEAKARRDAEVAKQEQNSQLELERIELEIQAEAANTELVANRIKNEIVTQQSAAHAEAKAKAASSIADAQADNENAKIDANKMEVEFLSGFEERRTKDELDAREKEDSNSLAIERAREEAQIEVDRFCSMVSALTPEVIKEMATAAPQAQAQLLSGLGLQSVMITDGNTPVNLFGTAEGLIGGASM